MKFDEFELLKSIVSNALKEDNRWPINVERLAAALVHRGVVIQRNQYDVMRAFETEYSMIYGKRISAENARRLIDCVLSSPFEFSTVPNKLLPRMTYKQACSLPIGAEIICLDVGATDKRIKLGHRYIVDNIYGVDRSINLDDGIFYLNKHTSHLFAVLPQYEPEELCDESPPQKESTTDAGYNGSKPTKKLVQLISHNNHLVGLYNDGTFTEIHMKG
jgi:hypothetical protein